MMRSVVAIDERLAETPLARVPALAPARDAEVVLVHVLDTGGPAEWERGAGRHLLGHGRAYAGACPGAGASARCRGCVASRARCRRTRRVAARRGPASVAPWPNARGTRTHAGGGPRGSRAHPGPRRSAGCIVGRCSRGD